MKWISVKDRVPEIKIKDHSSILIMLYSSDCIFIGLYCDGKSGNQKGFYNFDYDFEDWVPVDHITHWMPLPDPPEVGG